MGCGNYLSNLISPARVKQIQRSLNNIKLTLLCGFLTLLVLRGTLGAGRFGTPAKDLEEIKQHFGGRGDQHRKQLIIPSRSLAQALVAEKHKPHTNPMDTDTDDDADDEDEMVERAKLEENMGVKPAKASQRSGTRSKPYVDWHTRIRTRVLESNAHTAQSSKASSSSNSSSSYNTSAYSHSNIMLVTTGFDPSQCETPLGHHFLFRSLNNKLDYCRLHGIQIFYESPHVVVDANNDSDSDGDGDAPSVSAHYKKLSLLRNIMVAHPDVEWFWWMNNDAMFTHMDFELPMHKYEHHNMVVQGDWENMLHEGHKSVGLDIGSSFLIRNQQWSLDLLDAWAIIPNGSPEKLIGQPQESHPRRNDQSTLVHFLIAEKEKWGEKVYMEKSYQLHGTWPNLAENYEDIKIEKSPKDLGHTQPFISDFVGCKPCSKSVGDYNDGMSCFKQMQRAFNFADNQLLELYGVHHRTLPTNKV